MREPAHDGELRGRYDAAVFVGEPVESGETSERVLPGSVGGSGGGCYTTKSFQVWKPAGLQAMAREGAGAGIQ